MNIINILLLVIFVVILLSFNNNYLKVLDFFQKPTNDINAVSLFLNEKYGDILIPSNVHFSKENNYYTSNFNIIKNNQTININIKFTPINNPTYITKYYMFGQYGMFEIIKPKPVQQPEPKIISQPIIQDNLIESDTETMSTENLIDKLNL